MRTKPMKLICVGHGNEAPCSECAALREQWIQASAERWVGPFPLATEIKNEPQLSADTLANIERGIEQFKRGEGTIINFDEEEGELAVNQPDGERTLKSSNLGSPSPAPLPTAGEREKPKT